MRTLELLVPFTHTRDKRDVLLLHADLEVPSIDHARRCSMDECDIFVMEMAMRVINGWYRDTARINDLQRSFDCSNLRRSKLSARVASMLLLDVA